MFIGEVNRVRKYVKVITCTIQSIYDAVAEARSLITLGTVKELLASRVLWGEELLDREAKVAFGCDLLSDMLAYAPEGVLLLTGLTNEHLISTADIIGACGIVFVRGKIPDERVIRKAAEKGIPLLSTKMFLHEVCGVLYAAGLSGPVDPDAGNRDLSCFD